MLTGWGEVGSKGRHRSTCVGDLGKRSPASDFTPVVSGGNKKTGGSPSARVKSGMAGNAGWINPDCFTIPAAYPFGDEPHVDSLQASGIDNGGIAIFMHTTFGPDQKLGFEFRCETFNTFNHAQLNLPANGASTRSFGDVIGQ
jgi:hypothetical protein